jgi:formate dehydrogenase iron-sulfur subunit
MIKVYVPKDSSARALGADEVADAIKLEAAAQNISVQIIRNGSRGMAWLEPLVEVETAQGRMAFGPVDVTDVKALVKSSFKEGGKPWPY